MAFRIFSAMITSCSITMGFCVLKRKRLKMVEIIFLLTLQLMFWIFSMITKNILFTLLSTPLTIFFNNYLFDRDVKVVKNILYSISLTLIFLISDIVCNMLSNGLRMGILKNHIWIYKAIYFISNCGLIMLLSNIFGKIIQEFNINKSVDKEKKVNKIRRMYVSINIGIGAIMIILSYTINTMLLKNQENYFLNLIIFSLTILSSIFSATMYNKYSMKEMEIKRKNEEIERMEEYAGYMEELYNNIRQFKHDYKNILLSMEGYIEGKDYGGLETYFKEHILPTEAYIEKNDFLVKLNNIKILPLKSVIVSKLMKAQSYGCDIFIDIAEAVDSIPVDYIDCMRIFGVLLDNAIEETDKTKNKKLNFAIVKKGNSMIFVVQNSCVKKIEHIYKLTQKGFSTKGHNRGLGLYNLRAIVNKYENVTFNLESEDDMFTAEIWIRKEEKIVAIKEKNSEKGCESLVS